MPEEIRERLLWEGKFLPSPPPVLVGFCGGAGGETERCAVVGVAGEIRSEQSSSSDCSVFALVASNARVADWRLD